MSIFGKTWEKKKFIVRNKINYLLFVFDFEQEPKWPK
jgi:hypothetical protein